MSSVATELPREIERVIKIRSQYEALRGMPNVIVEPQIAMMSASISRAIQAASSGNVLDILAAYSDLKAYDE